MGSHSPVKILFGTSSEFGQSNVILAVAQELAKDKRFSVHVMSHSKLEKRIKEINEKELPGSPIIFHPIEVPRLEELFRRAMVLMQHPPGLPWGPVGHTNIVHGVLGFENSEYIGAYHACYNTIDDLKPAALVLDPIFWFAHDAARALGLHYVTLGPSSPKDLAGPVLPNGAVYWKYPFVGSGYSFPMSYWESFKNMTIAFWSIVLMLLTGHLQRLNKARREAGIPNTFPMTSFHRKEDLYLSPYVPEIDYPYDGLPSNVIPCGPIILPPVPISQSDPELAQWLCDGAPVVMINLGTLFNSQGEFARELAKGIKTLLDHESNIRVLWKLKYTWEVDLEFLAMMKTYLDSGRLRINSWLIPEPSALLASGRVTCSVHHGGANSYYEACRAGIPHVILPAWFDCYEFATRAEYHGFGIIGNKGRAPDVDGAQFGEALKQAVGDEDIRAKARAVGEACTRKEGRLKAAEEIADWARAPRPRS